MVKKVLASMFLGYLIFVLVMWFYSAQQIKQTCQQIQIGTPISKLEQILASLDVIKVLRQPPDTAIHKIILHSPYSMGSYTCQIQHNSQQVTDVMYQQLD